MKSLGENQLGCFWMVSCYGQLFKPSEALRNPKFGFRSDEHFGGTEHRNRHRTGSNPGINAEHALRNQTRISNSINLVLSFKFSKFNYVMTHQLKIPRSTKFGFWPGGQSIGQLIGINEQVEESKSESIKNRRTTTKWLLGRRFEVN